jgi:hypothetical protein
LDFEGFDDADFEGVYSLERIRYQSDYVKLGLLSLIEILQKVLKDPSNKTMCSDNICAVLLLLAGVGLHILNIPVVSPEDLSLRLLFPSQSNPDLVLRLVVNSLGIVLSLLLLFLYLVALFLQ